MFLNVFITGPLFGSLVPVMIFAMSIFVQSIHFVDKILEDAILIRKLIF